MNDDAIRLDATRVDLIHPDDWPDTEIEFSVLDAETGLLLISISRGKTCLEFEISGAGGQTARLARFLAAVTGTVPDGEPAHVHAQAQVREVIICECGEVLIEEPV
jgi:hypothetical protein